MNLRHRCKHPRGLGTRERSKYWTNCAVAALLMLSITAWSAFTGAAAPTITFESSATSVRVAEPFTVEWTVVAPRGAKVTFPDGGDELGNFDVLKTSDQFDVPLADSGQERAWTRRMTLETIFAGDQEIPKFEIQVHDAGHSAESSTVLRTQPRTIRVMSVLEDRADPTEFRDIESVVDVDVPVEQSRSWVWWTFGGAGGLAILALASVLVVRRRRGVTPICWAINELDDLKASWDLGQTDMGVTILRLTDIVRDFLLLELDLPESGHTAHEVVDEIDSRRSIDPGTIERLNDLFTLADSAKFGGLQLSNPDLENAIEDARELVHIIASSPRK